jgi:hypothetical protein
VDLYLKLRKERISSTSSFSESAISKVNFGCFADNRFCLGLDFFEPGCQSGSFPSSELVSNSQTLLDFRNYLRPAPSASMLRKASGRQCLAPCPKLPFGRTAQALIQLADVGGPFAAGLPVLDGCH